MATHDSMRRVKCMMCGKRMEYRRDQSAPRSNIRSYVCWSCDIAYELRLKEHLAIVGISKAR